MPTLMPNNKQPKRNSPLYIRIHPPTQNTNKPNLKPNKPNGKISNQSKQNAITYRIDQTTESRAIEAMCRNWLF